MTSPAPDAPQTATGTTELNMIMQNPRRSGLLDKAKNFIEENNINHVAFVWMGLLSACRFH
uniref:Uncharacterized protein n=1 Tax=Oryza barthii TaxID=65489 RepID=A0A0D3GNW6_9ORYZ